MWCYESGEYILIKLEYQQDWINEDVSHRIPMLLHNVDVRRGTDGQPKKQALVEGSSATATK